jgi:hypothetical protein
MQGVGPEDVGPQRKKAHVINDGALDPAVGRGVAGTSNHISRAVFSAQSVEQPRAPTIRLINEAKLENDSSESVHSVRNARLNRI